MLPELLTTKDKRMRIWNSLFCQEIPMTASTVPSMPAASQSFANIQVMQLTTAYWTSRCVHVVAELGVADHIGDLPQSTESLAKASGIRPDALHRVLRLLASVGIFEWKDNAWHHNEASRFLRSDHPASLRDYVRMLGLPVFWSAFEELEHSLRTGESAFAKRHAGGVFTYLAEHPEECHIFDAAMTSKSHRDIAAILPVRFLPIRDYYRHRRRTRTPAACHSQDLADDSGNSVRSAARCGGGSAGKRREAGSGQRRFFLRLHA